MSANCISLRGSTTCPSFQAASISTDSTLVGFFSFLRFVSDRASFDTGLKTYLENTYVQEKYQNLFGCNNIDLTNTSNLYARFTTTVICNAIVQNSIVPCRLSSSQAVPICADTCAQFAQSEAYYLSDPQLCSDAGNEASSQVRADFTNCALPADSLSSAACIQGINNEPNNCGFATSTVGLCSYCATGGINSTDTCCYNSEAEVLCANVKLPSVTPTISLPTSTALVSPSSNPVGGSNGRLSGGAIAGIVIGSLAGVGLIIGLICLCSILIRRRKREPPQGGNIFNQPSPARRGPMMSQTGTGLDTATPQGYEVLPGGRIARMSALEGHSGPTPSRHLATAATVGTSEARNLDDQSSSSEFGDSSHSENRAGVLRPPPTAVLKRTGSLSSGSVLLACEDAGGNALPSPQGVASQQSEQLPFFKDYYSQDEIHPGDRVAVLWAYQARAADEFALERGDMLKVIGIWDDGWATGVMLDERAEEWEVRRQQQRDSGVSNTSGPGREQSPPVSGEIKAFPLVCVCLPEHWRKTIEGEVSTETASGAPPT